ncbi:hypothetical protein JCM8097_003616 [Rhodosporidiobolus ruineniae]
MVLQSKHAAKASRLYKKKHATELDNDEDAALKAALEEAEKRRLGSNADRYREDDEALARELGLAGPGAEGAAQGGAAGEEEVDEEEEARKAAEAADLAAFLSAQHSKLLSNPSPDDAQPDDDDEDVDHSFAHLRIGGVAKRGVVKPVKGEEGDEEELRRMQDEARRMQAVRDLKDRFSGDARPLSSSSSSSSQRPFSLPPKPGTKTVKSGEDFLDTLL